MSDIFSNLSKAASLRGLFWFQRCRISAAVFGYVQRAVKVVSKGAPHSVTIRFMESDPSSTYWHVSQEARKCKLDFPT